METFRILEQDEIKRLLAKYDVSIDALNTGRKNFNDLCTEVQKKEATLIEYRGELLRYASSVKIIVDADGYRLLHQATRYTGEETFTERVQEFSISETRIRGEYLQETAIRGLQEECGLAISPQDIDLESYLCLDGHDLHVSSVYRGLKSCSFNQWVRVKLPERPWTESSKVLDDVGKQIRVGWYRL